MFSSSVSNKMLYTSWFPPDVYKYTGYENIRQRSGFGLLCSFEYFLIEPKMYWLKYIQWHLLYLILGATEICFAPNTDGTDQYIHRIKMVSSKR